MNLFISRQDELLGKWNQPYIVYEVHRCDCFATKPNINDTKMAKYIGRYVKVTRDEGLGCKPTNESLECFVDDGLLATGALKLWNMARFR